MARLLMIGSDTAVVRGIQGAFWNTLRGFHRFWEQIDILCPFTPNPKATTLFGNVHFHPLPGGKLRLPLSVMQTGMKVCRQQKPNLIVIHAYGMQLMSWGGLLLARKLGIPFVIEVHHVEGIPKAAEYKDYLRHLAGFTFIRTVRNEAIAFRVVNKAQLLPVLTKWGVRAEKTKVVYSIYLDTKIFQPISREPKTYDLIFVGRLVPNKGLSLLIKTFKHLKRTIPEVKFLIIGRGPLEQWLKERISKTDGIDYLPFLPTPQDIARAYNRSKVVVCGSYAEGGPRYVVEAMACGLPAVSTPVGLMKEVVRNYETGFLLNDWSPKDMAESILELLTDKDLYHKCSEQAHNVAVQFEYENMIAEYALTYRKLIES